MSFGTCSRCRTDGPLWPGTSLCDDCHYDDQREADELRRDDDLYDGPWDDDDFEDDEPVRAIEDVPTGRFL